MVQATAPPGEAPSDPIALLKQAFEMYKPHAMEVAKAMGVITIPLPVLGALLGFVPVVGGILALVLTIVPQLALGVYGSGVQAEIGLRLSAGAPIVASDVWRLQLKRLFPWFFGLLVPAIIAAIGSIFCLVPGILLGLFILPAYMVEQKKMFDVNSRSFDLIKKDWALSLLPPLLVWIPAVIVIGVMQFVLGFIPYAGPVLAALLQGVVGATVGPFFVHVVFRMYVALRQKYEQGNVAAELQAAVGRV
jgi:hypothetical protein